MRAKLLRKLKKAKSKAAKTKLRRSSAACAAEPRLRGC
jgi:hypothetical protein